MGKSRADIQRAYRERKKAEKGEEYLKKEAQRVKKYYVPTTEMPKKKLRERRENIRKAMKCKGAIDTMMLNNNQDSATDENNNKTYPNTELAVMDMDSDTGPCDSSTHIPTTSSGWDTPSGSQLTIKMNFSRNSQGRKKKSKALISSETKIRKLTYDLTNARRKNNALRQRVSRLDKHRLQGSATKAKYSSDDPHISAESMPVQQSSIMAHTPRRRSKTLLKACGLSPKRYKTIVKKLQLHESMVDDIKAKGHALNIACGKTTKRSRQISAVSNTLNLNRHKLLRKLRGPTNMQRRKMAENARIKTKAVEFMERDDNSSCLPGKADCLKTEHGLKQKRVLSDLLSNLHMKFRSENQDIRINLTKFGSYRPRNIKLVYYSSRKTCLCQHHQNMALKVKGLRSLQITNTTTPDAYIRGNTDEVLLTEIQQNDSTSIKYTEWRRVEVEYKGRKSKRMQVVQVDKPKTEFIEIMRKTISDFRIHCDRVKTQYEEIRNLKEQLPSNHAIIQMDFAENYVCSHADEVQSAYFDKGSVTLHPAVIYYKISNKLEHKSYVFVSDTAMHNSGTVLAFIKEIVPVARKLVSNLKTIHYVTDSPTSQYRNKHMFYTVANHEMMFDGVTASWQYFEAGHGTGPCDGVGGTAKRQADSAVKRQICSIQNADDFYMWGASQVNSSVSYIFVSNTKCNVSLEELRCLNIKPMKGTMTVHSVVSLGNSCIAVRNTSCFCSQCFNDGAFHAKCSGWNKHSFIEGPTTVDNNANIVQEQTELSTAIQSSPSNLANCDCPVEVDSAATESTIEPYVTGQYVAALYDKKWYIGLVQECDPEDNTYLVSFMREGNNKRGVTLKWPEKEDVCWRSHSEILCAVDEPIMYGKTRRMYKLTEEDLERVQNMFEY